MTIMASPQTIQELKTAGWLYRYKKKILIAILLLLVAVTAATMLVIGSTLRTRLIADSKRMTNELADVIEQSLSYLMLVRNPENIQKTLEIISAGSSSVKKAFILDNNGKVAYSSEASEIGTTIDPLQDPSCTGCHTTTAIDSRETTLLITIKGREVLRHVNIIYNEPRCHACHPASIRTNGKLIIDRSVQPTYSLIAAVELILAGAGGVGIVFLAPFLLRILSRGMDTYIDEIIFKSTELTVLYMIVERLSKTIEIDELKYVIIDIIRELYNAEEIDIILPRNAMEYGGITWKRSSNRIERRLSPNEDPFREIIGAWLRGEIDREKIILDGRSVYMPIAKGGSRFGLIFVRRTDRLFDAHDLELIRAMDSHIAVAFDNAALYHIAITDELTGLYSKRHFRNTIEKKFQLYEKYGETLSLLMIDIDDFKKVNDTYGHPAGDAVLRTVAGRVLSAIRERDLGFRYGGEEFAVLLQATESSGGVYVAERIREQVIAAATRVNGHELRVTVSIGVASIPEHARTIRDLVSEADKALYVAKKAGKNRVVLGEVRPG
jgi:diguanylate cyclase (GGDEF)-like protein